MSSRRSRHIRAVVFDLYETLVTQSGVDVPRAGALGMSFGLDAAAYRRAWKRLRPLALRGDLTFSEALTRVGAELGVEIAADRIRCASAERARANATVFEKADPDIVELALELAGRGVQLATISNCIAEDAAAWPGSAFAPHFGCAVFSFAARVVKPDRAIYLEALQRLGVHAEDAIYIGDGGDNELEGAERAGLRTAQATWFVSRDAHPGAAVLTKPDEVRELVLQ